MGSKPQEQTDPGDFVLARARAMVRGHPSIPRPVDTVGLALAMYRGKLLPLVLLVGVGTALFVITFFQPGDAITIWLLRLFLGAGTLFFLFAPGLMGVKAARWVRDGLTAQAEVTEAHVGLDRRKRREVRGRRIVHHPALGDFHDEFAIVAPWAEDVSRMSALDVLVAPTERETWVTLGVRHGMPRTNGAR
jgi:hypothetical protein